MAEKEIGAETGAKTGTEPETKAKIKAKTEATYHKVNFLVPKGLFERFKDLKGKDFRKFSEIFTAWMTEFVAEKEREQEAVNQESLKDVIGRSSDIIFRLSRRETLNDEERNATQDLANLLLELKKNPSTCTTSEFTAKLTMIERSIK
jgi:hypothetical protein